MAVGSSKRALQQHLSQMLKSMVSSAHGDHITTVMEGILKPGWRVPSSSCQGSHGVRRCYTRKLSQLRVASSRAFLVDTLALVRRLEAQGLAAKQAEAITAVMTEVLSGSLDDVTQSFVFKADMQRKDMLQETALSKVKAEMQSAQVFATNHVKSGASSELFP
ncbi:hypothetical protein O6H91_02G095900 [Diphasiastrum complanatum]|uniref:Uncharacterized protein n=1 Tax=Diphasiastrum complanatum TaxID=34168 RepID=A0ACC2EI59_DIPCM|nr:hypothetical protein O6H91_02G095900 [Diphasiastrum complanatum]